MANEMTSVVVDAPTRACDTPLHEGNRWLRRWRLNVSDNPERAIVKQGWIQTAALFIGMVATVLLAFSKLDAKADVALTTAIRAETKAADVDQRTHEMNVNLAMIRTILDERLPNANPRK